MIEPIEMDEQERQRRFHELFGVSEEELKGRGIDPDEYARSHIGEALKDRSKWGLVLPPSAQSRLLWTRWGFRGFVAMFIGIGFLALSKVASLHVLGLAGAAAMAVAAGWMYILMLRYRRQYRQACEAEGVPVDRRVHMDRQRTSMTPTALRNRMAP